jgi:hypothetical protein
VNDFRALPPAARRRHRFLPLLLIASLATPLMAGPAPRSAPPARRGDDVRETLQVLMIVSMKKALELTREQELEVVPRMQQILEERERFARERMDAMRRVQVKLAEESVPDQEFRSVVMRLDQLEKQYRDQEGRLRVEIDRALSARQQAELRLFVPRFRRQMEAQIEAARSLQNSAPRRATPPAAAEEENFSDDEEF